MRTRCSDCEREFDALLLESTCPDCRRLRKHREEIEEYQDRQYEREKEARQRERELAEEQRQREREEDEERARERERREQERADQIEEALERETAQRRDDLANQHKLQAEALAHDGFEALRIGRDDKALACFSRALEQDNLNFGASIGAARALAVLEGNDRAKNARRDVLSLLQLSSNRSDLVRYTQALGIIPVDDRESLEEFERAIRANTAVRL